MADGRALIAYESWRETCDTLHAHTQLLGKLALALAPPEPQLQHAALRLTARGWETLPLPAPDHAGAIVVALDLHSHEALVEHSDGRARRASLREHRSVGEVTREVMAAVHELVGPVAVDLRPQEVPWSVPLDEDAEHARYDAAQVSDYFAAATRAALVLAEFRAPYRGRSTPVNAWWGSFDLAVNLFSGKPAEPPSRDFIMRNAMDAQEVAIGWWPGDPQVREGGLLRLRASRAGRPRGRDAGARSRALGARARRVRPRLGGGLREPRSAPRGSRIRQLGVRARVRGVRMGPRARRQRAGHAAAHRLSAAGR